MSEIKLDFNNMMTDCVGPRGISKVQIQQLFDHAASAHDAVTANRGTGWLGWTELPYNQADTVKEIKAYAESVRSRFDTFVVLGIGGSALGPIAVHQALNHLRYNELPREKRGGPRFYVEDNIDPERMASLLDIIDVKTTCFNVITKSGGTAETMSQYLILTHALQEALGDKWTDNVVATTSETSGNLIKIAREAGIRTFYVPSSVGGRFSELCPVGLLPAAVGGIDIEQMLKGAEAMDKRCASNDLWHNPALLEAVLQYICLKDKGINIHVSMPYADSLKYMADWFCQLWGESLGKKNTRSGEPCGIAQTPTKSLGVTDQHSQLQLYTEGPHDKLITFMKVENYRSECAIPHGCENIPDVAFLGGKSLNQLITAEYQGTEYAITKAQQLNQTVIFPEVNADTIGQFIYFFELVTAYMGELLNIDAFNQPGVEESKIASYAYLGNESAKYAAKREEMLLQPQKKTEFII